MKVLYVGCRELMIPGILHALDKSGHEAAVYLRSVEEMLGEREEQKEKELENFLQNNRIDFVLSVIFVPLLAELTHKLQIKYAVYGMDSPMYATYGQELAGYENCYLFYFDQKEYQRLKQLGRTNVYYLPLAGDVESAGRLVITEKEIERYGCDISFVGGLYGDNVYDRHIGRFSDRIRQTFSEILEQSAFLWDGQDRIKERMTPEICQWIRKTCPELFDEKCGMTDEQYLKALFFGRKLTHIERTLLIEALAEQYDLHLYTRDNEQISEKVRRFPPTNGEDNALKIFYASKINLNITMRSIESGIPKRIFDIMSVGGFILTNWQEEVPQLFEEDKEIVTFKSPEELFEKADYYLSHDEERMRIGINGYRKIKECYTYEHQINKIISILYPDL